MSLSERDIRAIHDVSEAFNDVMRTRRFQDVGRLYTRDAMLMPPDHGSITGLDGIRSFLEGFPPMRDFDNVVDEISGEGDMAYVRGHFRMVMEPEPGGDPVVEEGKYLEIRHRQPDGSWPVTIDIFTPGT